MPMIPQTVIAMLAAAKIGAVFSRFFQATGPMRQPRDSALPEQNSCHGRCLFAKGKEGLYEERS